MASFSAHLKNLYFIPDELFSSYGSIIFKMIYSYVYLSQILQLKHNAIFVAYPIFFGKMSILIWQKYVPFIQTPKKNFALQ